MRAATALASCLLLLLPLLPSGLAAGLAPADANSEEAAGSEAAGGGGGAELEAAAAALAGWLAASGEAAAAGSAAGPAAGPAPLYRRRRAEPNNPDWIMGLGVLSNMQQFFDNLRNNLESLESLPKEERDVLLGANSVTSSEQERAFRPRATAAYLHALRNHRPSHKIRNFVADPEPASLRGSNHYDPNLLWTGLGRRR